LKECLLNAKNRGVKVYVLFWSSPILNFLGKDWLSMRTKEGFNALKSIGINVLIDQGRGFFPTLRWS